MYELIAVALFVLVVLAFCAGYFLGKQRGVYPEEKRRPPLIKRKIRVKLQPVGVTLHTAKEEADIEKKLKKQEGDVEEEEEEELEE